MNFRLLIYMFFCLTIGLESCTQEQKSGADSKGSNAKSAPSADTGKTSVLSYQIINAPDHTFGYDIYSGSNIIIHQESVPAQPGNKGFSTRTDAEKVARMVMSKLQKGMMPPTITIEELKTLNVIK